MFILFSLYEALRNHSRKFIFVPKYNFKSIFVLYEFFDALMRVIVTMYAQIAVVLSNVILVFIRPQQLIRS